MLSAEKCACSLTCGDVLVRACGAVLALTSGFMF